MSSAELSNLQIPETPQLVEQLDLMRRLKAYEEGTATWYADGKPVGEKARSACGTLHTNLKNLVNGIFAFLLDRVTAREMETFTMHDRVHGRKVAHLMWHILTPEKRKGLTPPEIGMLIVAAHLHDMGMGLSRNERNARLDPTSDLWDRLEVEDSVKVSINELRNIIEDPKTSDPVKLRAENEMFQAEEALLSQDTRERHATRARYEEIVDMLANFHEQDRVKIPDIEAALSFDGDSFRDKLIDVCISHNEDADALVSNDERNYGRPRFPVDYPVGCCTANLHLVAAALRLADILDFDRERTPAVLFHYLLPSALGPAEHRSVLEWGKHLAISNWHIEKEAIVFRGRSRDHIIHHAVVQFCAIIADEIKATRATFTPLEGVGWPFILPSTVRAEIHEEGYKYIPYRFELDDDRVYTLLMGGAIYDNPLVAVRELVQNSVDACKLRDSITTLYEPHERPSTENRIIIRYEEPTAECPQARLTVKDTGTGMDAYILERYFLQVGRSYYSSSDFNQMRVEMRKSNLDFAPVSEFGIGFLSVFLLANHVEVETAMWESPRGDMLRRLLQIDGPTRLIRLDERVNEGPARLKGTRITLFLTPKREANNAVSNITWEEVKEYLREVCQDLPYSLNLEHISDGQVVKDRIDPLPLRIELSPPDESTALRIPVNDADIGLEGEIVLFNRYQRQEAARMKFEESPVSIIAGEKEDETDDRSALLRGGFRISGVPGLSAGSTARIRFTWSSRTTRRYMSPNLARNNTSEETRIAQQVFRIWLTHLFENRENLQEGLTYYISADVTLNKAYWLEKYDALTLYNFARPGWIHHLRKAGIEEEKFVEWEEGKGEGIIRLNPFDHLNLVIIELILPRITTRRVDKHGQLYLNPPREDWRLILKDWRDYISSPIKWSRFIEFSGEIEDALFSWHADLFNLRYEDRLSSWGEQEIDSVVELFNKIIHTFTYRTPLELKTDEVELFSRVMREFGDLKIVGYQGQEFKLAEIKIPGVS
jgi:hypothetical protein